MENTTHQYIIKYNLQWRCMESNKERRRRNQQNIWLDNKAKIKNTTINTQRMPIPRNRPHGPNYNRKKKQQAQYAQQNIQWKQPNPQRPPTENGPLQLAGRNQNTGRKNGLGKDILTANNQTSKKEITNKIIAAFKENKWNLGNELKYMKTLTRNEVNTIFKARTRMLDVKAN